MLPSTVAVVSGASGVTGRLTTRKGYASHTAGSPWSVVRNTDGCATASMVTADAAWVTAGWAAKGATGDSAKYSASAKRVLR